MAVEAPKWFDENFYFNAKAGQLNAIKYNGKADWTGTAVKAAFGEMSAYEHYMAFGNAENISPSAMFNVAEYLKAKADQLNADKFDGKTTWTEADVLKGFNDSGLSAWDHFIQYGMAEGLNPSNMFDVDAYLADKADQLNSTKFDGKTDWTADDVAAAFKGAGLNPVQHYYLYGQGEGLTISTVPTDDRAVTNYNPYTPVNPGTTFPLTSAADTFEGTAKDDTINGVSSALSADRTLNAEDIIDGKEGNDTLNVAMEGNFNGFTTGSMVNVENVVLTADGSIPLTFNAKGTTGVDTWTLNSQDAPINLSELDEAGITVNVLGLKEGTTSIGFTADAVKGSDDALTLGLNNVGTAESAKADAKHVVVNAAGIEDLTVNVTDDNYVNLSNAATDTITVKGAGDLDVSAVANSLTSFDASGLSGDVDANLSGATLKTVKGGSGDDVIVVSSLAVNAVIDGGAGNDTLVLAGVSGTLQPTIKGFEEIAASGGDLTISGKNVSDFNALTVMNDADVTLVNMNTPTFTVTSEGATAGSVTLTDATALTYNTVADDQSIEDKTADAISTSITAGKATSATVNVGAYTAVAGGALNFGAAKDLTINVDSGLGTDGKTEMTSFGGTVTAGSAQSLIIKAKGNLGAATYNVGAADSVIIEAAKGSTGINDINAAKASYVSITAGANMDITGSDFASAQNVTLVQNKGALTGAVDLGAVNELTVSGAGKDSAITLGALGTSGQTYGINVDASGLKGGLTVGAINSGLGDVTLNLDDVTGLAKTGTIDGKNVNVYAAQLGTTVTGAITATGSVFIDAMGVLGGGVDADAFTAGAIDAKALTINFDGSSDMTFGAIANVTTGSSVNIDASGYLGSIGITDDASTAVATFGTISADSVTIKGSEIGANTFATTSAITANTLNYTGGLDVDTVSVTGRTTGTKMDVTLNTGMEDDIVTVAAGTATNTIIVKGNMGGNDDTITVSAAVAIASTIDLSGLKGYAASTITGSSAKDTLIGGAGNDEIKTGTNATLKSGDILTGGAGADIFNITLATAGSTSVAKGDITAIITDFGNGADTIKGFGAGSAADAYVELSDSSTDLADLWANIKADSTVSAADGVYIVVGMIGSDAYAFHVTVTDQSTTAVYTAGAAVQLAGVNLDEIAAGDFAA